MAKLDIGSVYKVARAVRADGETPVGVAVAGDNAPVLAALLGGAGGTAADAQPAALRVLPHGTSADLTRHDIVVLMAGDAATEAVVRAARKARSRLVVAVPPGSDAEMKAAAKAAGAYDDEMVAVDPAAPGASGRLAAAVAHAAGSSGPALARKLPALRDVVVRALVQRVARQNAAVGVVVWVPGADMPVMTLNQVRMVLQIGAAYGADVSPQRVPEVLAVVGAGLGLRTAARQVLGMVPVAGWALKGAMGYAGTLALGRAAIKYFESGAVPVDPSRVKGLLTRVVRRGTVQTG